MNNHPFVGNVQNLSNFTQGYPMLDHVNCSTPDLAEETARKLAALLPECAGENGEIDLDKLRQCLSSKAVEGNVERYRFEWPGKRAAMAAASAATTKTLRPCRGESVDYDTTGNLYIEGDNLEVLKLLQTSYAGRVKMIYIDPPYNTGHDFVYRDRFSLTQKELDNEAGAFDEDGNRFEVNDSAEARYHSNWCSMMWPRLKLARNLLRDDGVIFISIDDNEVTNLRKLCDEIFGETNFVCCFKWNRTAKAPSLSDSVRIKYEYVVCYKRDKPVAFYGKQSYNTEAPLLNLSNRPSVLIFPVGTLQVPTSYEVGKYSEKYAVELIDPVRRDESSGCNSCDCRISARFKWTQSHVNEYLAKGFKFLIKKDPSTIYYKMDPTESFIPPADVINDEECGVKRNTEAQEYMREIGLAFDFSKPVSLLSYLLKMHSYNNSGALILDFFSGSATTAHAVMALNAEDGGHRKFIMVQLPEPCDEDSEAAKAGYKNICEIGKERIRRAGKKIAEELAAKNAKIAKDSAQGELGLENPDNPVNPVEREIPDIGFRVLKLDTSSLIDAGVTTGEAAQGTLALSRIRDDRSPEDLLFQVLLETRLPLSDSIATAKVGGNEVFFVGGTGEGAPLVACLDPKARMDSQFFIEVAKLKPGLAFFRDDAFADDSARTNLQQVFNQFSPTTSVKVI